MSCLDKPVSFYKDCYDAKGIGAYSLLGFLDNDIYKEDILEIRSLKDSRERRLRKLQLPCATVSGIFTERNSGGLLKHSCLIGIDIDKKDNLHLDFSELQGRLTEVKNIAYCGQSVNDGLFLIIPIINPENHLRHFKALERIFKDSYGSTIDPKCSNIDRLRTISYNESAYFNHEAIPFDGSNFVRPVKQSNTVFKRRTYTNVDSRVEDCMKAIEEDEIDITGNEYDWWKIGCAVANQYNAAGRFLFHRISRHYANSKYSYSPDECDRMYDKCLEKHSKYTIGTFFYYFDKSLHEQ